MQAVFDYFKTMPKPTPPIIVPPPVAQPPHTSKITTWALAIQHAEGGKIQDRNTVNKNPGNIRHTPYTATLKGVVGTDAANFCVFDTYTDGFNALCQFLTDAANGFLKPYPKHITLDAFTTIYAQPPNKNYVKSVATALNVPITTPIENLL